MRRAEGAVKSIVSPISPDFEGNDTLGGGAGADTLWSEAGDDLITGGDGDDGMLGGDGADQVYAGAGADTVEGGGGGDFLRGQDGADVIRGGDGADVLIGDGGADHLYGDGGADLFTWLAAGDSAIGASDVVFDFLSGVDKLDFRPITAGGAASWVLLPAGGGYHALDIDVGNDGTVDLRVILTPGVTLAAGDILF